MVRPLLVANFAEIVGGGEIGLRDLAMELEARGFRPIVAVPGKGPVGDGLHAVEIPVAPPGSLVALYELARRTDIIHTTGARGCFFSAMARTKKPLIWHVRVAARDKLDPFLSRLPDAIIANSRATAARFPGNDRVHVVYNGIRPPDTTRPPLLAPTPNKRIGIIGRMTPEKGHLDLLPAIDGIFAVRADVEFHFFGSDHGAIGERIHALAAAEPRIRAWGFHEGVADHLREFDLIVIPSQVEGFGRVAVEALFSGIPVAARQVGGLLEVLEGLEELFLPESPTAWASRILDLLEDPPYPRARLMDAAARFSLDRHVDEVIRIYEELM